LCESPAEEIASVVTHGIGAVLAVAALVYLWVAAAGDPLRNVAALIFGGSLVLLYLASTLYHAASSPRAKEVLQTLDHACIYVLIAGSYTPLALVGLRGPLGWTLLAVVWLLALAGVLVKTLGLARKNHWGSTALYVVMGWLALIAIGPIARALPVAGVVWLVAGGVLYTLGVAFFAWQRLRFNHAIWHLFVLAGSACHVITAAHYIFT
jgi:hemolysin III